jgi:hypothetical protein
MEVDCTGEISQCIAVILLLLGWGFVRFGEMEESCLLLCLLYPPKEKRTSIYVRSTFLATWAHCHSGATLRPRFPPPGRGSRNTWGEVEITVRLCMMK